MTSTNLEDLLKKISLQSLYMLTGITEDPFTVQDEIVRYSYSRPITDPLQILEFSTIQKDCMYLIRFGFSPNFMLQNQFTTSGFLPDILWKLKIFKYDYGIDPDGSDEEGLATWLSRSKIEVDRSVIGTYELSVSKLENLLVSFKQGSGD
jgi:hypothetical protein